MKTILIVLVALLAGCDLASMRAYEDGTCLGSVHHAKPGTNAQITRKQEGTHVTCSIEFEVVK